MTESFGTALNCIDGRVQEAVARWVKGKWGVNFVDIITEPGIAKVMSDTDEKLKEHVRNKVEISVRVHRSKVIAIAGHHGCAVNSAAKETQWEQIRQSVKEIDGWGYRLPVAGLWVNENLEIEEVSNVSISG